MIAISICVVFYLGTISLIVAGAKIRETDKVVLLQKCESDYLKGVAALMVVLAHFQNFMEVNKFKYSLILKPFSIMGGMGVLLFFFLSGYGMYKGYSENKTLSMFWKKRFKNVFGPAIIISTMSCLAIDLIMAKNSLSLVTLLRDIFAGQWYVDVLMIECFVFSLLGVFVKKIKDILYLFV